MKGQTPQHGSLEESVYNRLLKERIIWLGEEVREDNANIICAQMLLLAAEDPEKDIYLYINSPGGSVTAGMAIYDTMQFIQPDVVTVGMGMAASMGQFLLSAQPRGHRQYRRRGDCHRQRRPGCGVLDVADGLNRHEFGLCRIDAGAAV